VRSIKKKLYLGWSPARNNPKPWEFFNLPYLMINALDFKERNQLIVPISQTINFKGEVFCDSGGFQLISRGISPNPLEILNIQRKLKADINAVLDNPNDPNKHLYYCKIYSKEATTERNMNFVPVIPVDLTFEYINKIKYLWPNPPKIAIGKVVPNLFPLKDQNKIINILKKIIKIKQYFPESEIHVFGLGGIATLIIFFHFIDSTDTSCWIHDARFSKLRMIGGGIIRPKRPKSMEAFRKENLCGCPICQQYGNDILDIKGSKGFQLRAIHNAWVLNKEIELLNQNILSGKYYNYIFNRAGKSNWHKKILEKALTLK